MRIPALLVLCTMLGCRATERDPSAAARLGSWMTGSFSSASQASAAPDDYFDIRLYMVPIWDGRADGPWLYVEQAAASALERPYRQRVYQVFAAHFERFFGLVQQRLLSANAASSSSAPGGLIDGYRLLRVFDKND